MKRQKRLVAMLLTFALVLSTAFVPTSAAKKVTVKKVTVASKASGSNKTVYVAKGKSAKLTATVKVTPNKKANKKVSYSVKDKKIATVSNKGVIKGKKVGTTKVTVTSQKNKKKKATITVKVTGKPVTKVKLNKTKKTLNVGESLALKATVKAGKGACKTLNWTTSKKKVATVSSKGVVKAVGTGTATITAQAIDGSGKKATCKITVKNPINLAAMDVLNAQTVTFSLDKPCALSPEQVSIKTKSFANGAYRKSLKIESMTSADNMNYNVIVSSDTRIDAHDFVQVAIPSLTGTVKSLEKEYTEQVCAFTSDQISTWTVGEYNKIYFNFGSGNGYSEYAISGLPAGLTSEIKGNNVWVKGTPTTAGTTTATLTAVDEFNNTLTKTIYFVIGSDAVIAGAATPVYDLISADSNYYVSSYVTTTGGSGSYTYKIIADPQNSGATLGRFNDNDYGDDYEPNYVRANIKIAGDYTVTVRVTDNKDANKYCDVNVVFHIAQGISVGGCIKDATGNPMNVGYVSFENKNRADRYFTEGTFGVNSETGVYSAIISPGTYDIEASRSPEAEAGQATNYLYNQTLTASQTGFDLSLPLYKVVLTSNDPVITSNIKYEYWEIDHARIGSGSTIYVKAGNYTIDSESEYYEVGSSTTSDTGTWFNGGTVTTTYPRSGYKYSAVVSVANTSVQAGVTKVKTKDDTSTSSTKYPAAKDTPCKVTELDYYYDLSDAYTYDDDDKVYYYYYAYQFTPEETGFYKIDNYNYNNPVKFYDATTGNPIQAEEDGSYQLTKNTKYIVGCGSRSSYSFKITKVTPVASGDAQ